MAHYNTQTDKIVGCKKGTLVYWHEYGHKVFHKNKIVKEMYDCYQGYIFFVWLSMLTIQKYDNAWICLIIIALMILIDELYAWWYAIKKYISKDRNP